MDGDLAQCAAVGGVVATFVPSKGNFEGPERSAASRVAVPPLSFAAHLLAIPKWPAQPEGPHDAASNLELQPRITDFS